MSQAQALAERIYTLAAKLNLEPSTLSRKLLGNGVRLGELASGKSDMTLDTYSRVEREVGELERGLAA